MFAITVIAGEPAAGAIKRSPSDGARGRLVGLLIASLAVGLAGCDQDNTAAMFGDPKHGIALIKENGCGTCHVIPGIEGADGLVGPPLNMMGRRIYIAGVLRNTPDNMMRWIRDPQKIVPGNAMPEMGITEAEARDLAAFLETLR